MIPQRFWNFDKRSGIREDFWGLYVREQRSAPMMAMYVVACAAPLLVFAALFLLGFVTGDLQNATTPLAMSMTAFGVLIVMVDRRSSTDEMQRA